ncbi:MAG TPA: hypothetical protein VGF59_37005 [Bryobacteraceae bacterium]
MLAVTVAFVGTDELLENASHHVRRYFVEVHGFDAAEQAAPGIKGVDGMEDKLGLPIPRVGHQQRFIVAASLRRPLEEVGERLHGVGGLLHHGFQFQTRQIGEAGAEGLVKDQSVCPNVGQGLGHVVHGLGPFFMRGARESPVLLGHPTLDAQIEGFGLVGLLQNVSAE